MHFKLLRTSNYTYNVYILRASLPLTDFRATYPLAPCTCKVFYDVGRVNMNISPDAQKR